jgi:predicted nuclease with TOPRIM domain
MDEATILHELSLDRSQTITNLKQTITTHEQTNATHEKKVKERNGSVEELAKECVALTKSNNELIKKCDFLKKEYNELLKRLEEVLCASIYSPEKSTIPNKIIASIHSALGEMHRFFETSRLDKIQEKERSAFFARQKEERDKLISSFVQNA